MEGHPQGQASTSGGMAMHLVADPTWGQTDTRVVQRLRGMANVEVMEDGAVIARKNIPIEDELMSVNG